MTPKRLQQAINRLPKDSQLVIQSIVVNSELKIQQREVMADIGILSKFESIAIHSFWKSYYQYGRGRTRPPPEKDEWSR